MTALTVLWLRSNGLVLGALTTAAGGDPPTVDPQVVLDISVPLPPSSTSSDRIPLPVAVRGSEIAIAVLEAEFADPAEVFDWRVTSGTAPGGFPKPQLDRLATGAITATWNARVLRLRVPRLGSLTSLHYDVRSAAGLVKAGDLGISSETIKTFEIPLPSPSAGTRLLVSVEGYATLTVTVPP